MPRNTNGGNKAKGFARKTFKVDNSLRVSQDESEQYAQVSKLLGGSMCHVCDTEGTTLLCHIRGKFRGRGKRANFITSGTWVLIGLREWEKEPSKGKLLNCDLLEVYSDHDKERLKNNITSMDWSRFVANDIRTSESAAASTGEEAFEFASESTDEYVKLIEQQVAQERKGSKMTTIADEDGDESDAQIDVDDI